MRTSAQTVIELLTRIASALEEQNVLTRERIKFDEQDVARREEFARAQMAGLLTSVGEQQQQHGQHLDELQERAQEHFEHVVANADKSRITFPQVPTEKVNS